MTALPSLVSSISSSSSEDTSSVSVELDNNIRASLTLPGLSNNARSVTSQPGSVRPSARNQNMPRLGQLSNHMQTRHANRANHERLAPRAGQGDSYFHRGDSNHASKSYSECNLSICYSYLLAAISSMMVVVGIYFSLTRLNWNYLYLSLGGLLLEILGACLYCLGNVQMNRKARRKLRLSDDFEGIDGRNLAAAAAAATHILNTRGLIQISNNNLNPTALRSVTNTNFTTSPCGTNNNDSLLVMIAANSETSPNSPNPPVSAQKHVKKVPLENSVQQTTIQQFDEARPQQDNDLLIDAEARTSSSEDNEVAISQLSLNMIPQYFSNGVSLRPNKSSDSSGPSSSNFIHLATGVFGKVDSLGETSAVNNEKSLNVDRPSFHLGDKYPVASSSIAKTTAATSGDPSSSDQITTSRKLDQSSSRMDSTMTDAPNKVAVGPLSQSQIVNVNGRQFLILPLNEKNTSLNGQSTALDTDVQKDDRNVTKQPGNAKKHSGPSTVDQIRSPYTQETTEELIDRIRTLTSSDSRQQKLNDIDASSRPRKLRRESSFTFNSTQVSSPSGAATSSSGNSSPRALKQSHSFNDKFCLAKKVVNTNQPNLVEHDLVSLSCKNKDVSSCQQPNGGEPHPSSSSPSAQNPPINKTPEMQPCSSRMLEPPCIVNSIQGPSSCVKKTAHSLDETADLNHNYPSSDRRGSTGNFLAGTSGCSNQKQLNTVETHRDHELNNIQSDTQPPAPTSSVNGQDISKKIKRSNSSPRASSSNAHHRTTLIMGLSGEEELIEINEADIDNMCMLPPSYESLMR